MRKRLSSFGFSKKGNVMVDSLFSIIAISLFVVVAIVAVWILYEVNTEVQADDDLNTDTKETMSNISNTSPTLFNYGVGIAFALMWMSVVIFSFYIDSHPVFFIVSFLALIVVIMVAYGISEGLQEITDDNEFAVVTRDMPIPVFIIAHLPKFAVAIGASIALALYAKTRQQ